MKRISSPIGTALIGCGKVGLTHAQALAELPESRFVAVFDRSEARSQAIATRYGTAVYTDLQAMLQRPDVQMATICTPNHTHPEMVEACAETGVHALVEKPMAIDLQGCDRAILAADQAAIRLGVISQRRLYRPVLRVKQAIEAGKIGKPVLGTLTVMGWRDEAYYRMDAWRGCWSTEGGGVLLTQTPHQLDLFQWFMGPIAEVFGYWDNFNHPYIEVEDTAIAVARFQNGGMGTILVSNAQKPGFYGKIHIHGSNGASVGVQTDGGSPFVAGVTEVVEPPINDIWTIPGEEHFLKQWQADDETYYKTTNIMTYYHRLQIQDFLQAILDNRAVMIDGREGRKHVELFTAIYRSQRQHLPIRFPLDPGEDTNGLDGR